MAIHPSNSHCGRAFIHPPKASLQTHKPPFRPLCSLLETCRSFILFLRSSLERGARLMLADHDVQVAGSVRSDGTNGPIARNERYFANARCRDQKAVARVLVASLSHDLGSL